MIIQVRKKMSFVSRDKKYIVLEIGTSRNGDINYRIEGDDNTPVLVNSEDFEIISNKLPTLWVAQWYEVGSLVLRPSAWTRLGFWEEYFNGEPEAKRIYEEEKNKIIEESLSESS